MSIEAPFLVGATAVYRSNSASEPRSLLDVLANSVSRWPAALAIDDGDYALTYRELDRVVGERAAALRAEGNGYVQAVMNRLFEVAQKKESLASAFRKLTARNLSIIPVVEDERLIGIVTLQNLMHSMALLAESRKLRKAALNS